MPTRRERLAKEVNIPGSTGWILNKNVETCRKLQKPICRNNLSFKSNKNTGKIYNNEAIDKGWEYNEELQTWTHEVYPNKTFSSLLQYDGNVKKPIPYANQQDHLGLGYLCNTICAGTYTKIRPNNWYSVEFDTRRGRRRDNFEQKKKNKKLFLSQEYINEFGFD